MIAGTPPKPIAPVGRLPFAFAKRHGVLVRAVIDGKAQVVYQGGAQPSAVAGLRRFLGVPIVISRNGVTQMGHELASKLGMTLFGRASQKHFICYCGFERFDAEPEPERAPVRVVSGG